jgi:phenylacetic acid degradation operon negative regulatory protein
MQPRTEEFLNFLLWTADRLSHPTFRNLTESYESWAYRNGLLRQLRILRQRELIESASGSVDDRLYRLTEKGRLHALGGRDPQKQWTRPWDGRWRLVLFDVPMARNAHREKMRRYLRSRGCGCLQGSVWVTPDPLQTEREILAGGKVDVASLLLLEARPCAGESDAEIVSGAWDFDLINQLYSVAIGVLDRRPSGSLHNPRAAGALRRWAAEEREAWLAAVTEDPLLPEPLLPAGYFGRRAWQRRLEVLRDAGSQIRSFPGATG